MEQVNSEHLAQLAEAQAELAAAELDAGRLTLLNMALERKIEKAQREATELRDELAALKAQSAEPVAWMYDDDRLVEPMLKLYRLENTDIFQETPLYRHPPSTALVDDFKRRTVSILRDRVDTTREGVIEMIESLPLIEGEKE